MKKSERDAEGFSSDLIEQNQNDENWINCLLDPQWTDHHETTGSNFLIYVNIALN